LGKIVNGGMHLNELGRKIEKCWKEILDHFPNVELDEFVVMPNHIHGIICILENDVGRYLINQIPTRENQFEKPHTNFPLMKNPKITLGKIIRYYKARTCKLVHDTGHTEFQWQSSYYEHIIRNSNDLNNIREYIFNNPLKW
jgi:REP element-mobilizing transposase RayT